MPHYLIEFRLHGYAKKYVKTIIYDVARKFRVKGITRKRPVPHITLFGPFTTRNQKKLVSSVVSAGKKYDLVPFKIKGFNHFRNEVIFLDIEPSNKLKKLRRDLAKGLLKISRTKSFDKSFNFSFHATVAFKDIRRKFSKIWNYIKQKEELNIKQHLLRITIIKNSRILYEYDLLQKRLLNRNQAKNKGLWKKTIRLLKQKTKDFSQDLDEKEGVWEKIINGLRWWIG